MNAMHDAYRNCSISTYNKLIKGLHENGLNLLYYVSKS